MNDTALKISVVILVAALVVCLLPGCTTGQAIQKSVEYGGRAVERVDDQLDTRRELRRMKNQALVAECQLFHRML